MLRPPPRSTLFPYTTLFRSVRAHPPQVRRDPPFRLGRRGVIEALFECRRPRVVVTARPLRIGRSEEHTSELQSLRHLVCRLLLEKKKKNKKKHIMHKKCTHRVALVLFLLRFLLSSPFFFNAPATTAIYTLSLHDALPICSGTSAAGSTRSPIPTRSPRRNRGALRVSPPTGSRHCASASHR